MHIETNGSGKSDAGTVATTNFKPPRVSIGVPVYNGAKYLRATLDSILAQTYKDFELVISDNGSTDSSPQIIDEYARRDSRIRVFRFPRNMGPAANYNKVLELARGELFKWAAGDDVLAPTFLEKCIPVLDADPTVIDVYPLTKRIDGDGKIIGEFPTELNLTDRRAWVRFFRWIFVNHRKHHSAELWGVMRTSALRMWTPTKGAHPSADRVVINRLVLVGKLHRVEEFLFFDRTHSGRSELAMDKSKIRQGSLIAKHFGCGPTPPYQWWDTSKVGKIVFPEWKWLYESARGPFVIPLPLGERALCLAGIVGLTIKFVPRLARDVLIAAEQTAYRIVDAIKRGKPGAVATPVAQ